MGVSVSETISRHIFMRIVSETEIDRAETQEAIKKREEKCSAKGVASNGIDGSMKNNEKFATLRLKSAPRDGVFEAPLFVSSDKFARAVGGARVPRYRCSVLAEYPEEEPQL